jgi:hypothetical protein
MKDFSSRDVQSIARCDDGGPALLVSFPGSAGLHPDCSVTSLHEAAHCIVGRYYGLPIGVVTVIPTEHFWGAVRGSEADLEASPETILKAAEAICAEAVRNMPAAGEDPSVTAEWHVHVTCRVTELLAGYEGERLGGSHAAGEVTSLDLKLARIYAATICQPGAVWDFLQFCRSQASAILKQHWEIVLELSAALDSKGCLNGAEIDAVILEAGARADLQDEKRRRAKMQEMEASAAKVPSQFRC